uniref:Telomere repeats-binding bouquet formation protein 2 n=1 Tax=Periophthalmus magnuspinnatus TaxID=409849 RepID=A0A3B3ZMF7_9GOBI
MFRNRSAWFSRSVPKEAKTFWKMEGGTLRDWRTADYLFSQDASCPDTKSIYFSRDYLSNKVTVFHSFFLSVCEKRKSFQSMSIGHYVLPPDSVQEEVRNVIGRLIWERDDSQDPEVSYVSMDSLPKYSGPLSDFCPGRFRHCACRPHCCSLHT